MYYRFWSVLSILNIAVTLAVRHICYTLYRMPELHVIAHNIRSAENVGSLFRTADALGVAKIWVVGYSPDTAHPKVSKTALGAEKTVMSENVLEIGGLLRDLRDQGFRIVGLELDPRAVPLAGYRPPDKVALVLGNEVDGIPPWVRDLCEDLVYIPQLGVKESLNVSVAAAIAAYAILVNSNQQ